MWSRKGLSASTNYERYAWTGMSIECVSLTWTLQMHKYFVKSSQIYQVPMNASSRRRIGIGGQSENHTIELITRSERWLARLIFDSSCVSHKFETSLTLLTSYLNTGFDGQKLNKDNPIQIDWQAATAPQKLPDEGGIYMDKAGSRSFTIPRSGVVSY